MPAEVYLLLAGIVLMAIELIVPGFGIFGIGGMICLTWGGYYIMGGGVPAVTIIAAFYILLALLIGFLCFYLPRESKWNPFVLWDKQKNSDGYTGGQDLSMLLGKTGVALTALRPAGTIIVGGQRLDVSSQGDYIVKDTAVKIVKVEGSKIFVEQVKE